MKTLAVGRPMNLALVCWPFSLRFFVERLGGAIADGIIPDLLGGGPRYLRCLAILEACVLAGPAAEERRAIY
jgi:hypothetical protein